MSVAPLPARVYDADAAPVRLGGPADLAPCLAVDDSFRTAYVWQMEVHRDGAADVPGRPADADQPLGVKFRSVRLPLTQLVPGVAATYSRHERLGRWERADALLVAGPRPPAPDPVGDPPPVPVVWGYALLAADRLGGLAWVHELAVGEAHRGHGLGSRLLEAAKAWAGATVEAGGAGGCRALLVDLAPKNAPAIAFCRRRGFRFCGHTDYTAVGGDIHLYFLCPLTG